MTSIEQKVAGLEQQIKSIKASQIIGGDNYTPYELTVGKRLQFTRRTYAGNYWYVFVDLSTGAPVEGMDYLWLNYTSANTIMDYDITFERNGVQFNPTYDDSSFNSYGMMGAEGETTPMLCIFDSTSGYYAPVGIGLGRALDYMSEDKNVWQYNTHEKICLFLPFFGTYQSTQSVYDNYVGNIYTIMIKIRTSHQIDIAESYSLWN